MHQNAKMASNSKSIPSVSTASQGQAQFIGIVPEYDGDTDDWSVYQEILEEYFKANGVPDSNKVSVLISVIGTDTYRLLRDLCHPDSPKYKSYAELCAMLAKQFLPEIAIFRERAKFYRAEQQRDEDVKTWYARLKNYSVNCKFGDHLEPLLLDKFVVGLAPGPIQDRLCEESEKLTLKEALDLAANRESAVQDETMVHDMAEMNLEEHRRGGWKHGGRHRHRGRHHDHDHFGHGHGHGHGGPPHHGRHGHHGREMEFGFGPRGPHGPPGPHGHGPHGHGPHGHGPHAWGRHPMGPIMMGRFGPRGFHDFEGMMGPGWCMRRHEMKRWAKFCRKMQGGRKGKPCSGSSSSSSSSSSSDSDSDNDEKKCKGRRSHGGGHKKGDRHGKFGHHGERGSSKCPWGKRRGGRKDQQEVDPIVTENTEPELIE